MCRPEFLPDINIDGEIQSFIDLRQMVHPCVSIVGNRAFIPNDTLIDPKND